MTAIRDQITAQVIAQLISAGIASEVELMASGDPATFPALHVFDEGQVPVTGEAGTERFDMRIGIDGYVAQHSGAAALAAMNALYSGVIEALFPQPYLGGLVEEIEQGSLTVNVAERASERRLAFSLDLTISYATRRGSPQIID